VFLILRKVTGLSLEMIFLTSLIVGLTGAMVPGPLLTVTIAESARRGFRAGPLLIAGHGILEAVLVVALTTGLATFLVRTEVTAVIATVGGSFLLWMGFTIGRDALLGRIELAVTREPRAKPERPARQFNGTARLLGLGIVTSLSNPYFTLWWATIGLSYITLSLERGIAGLAAFYTGHILADLAWYCLVAGAVVGSGRFLTPVIYRGVLAVCGSFLVFLGVYFIYSGLVKSLLLG
jgi:threonine/homoserine/homoserine lactone efflux protein